MNKTSHSGLQVQQALPCAVERKGVGQSLKLLVLVSALAVLSGCGTTLSQGIDDQGGAQSVVFPDPQKDASLPEGSYPNLDNLRHVRKGLTKNQVQQLIGAPHFAEGFGPREWDYLFHLPPETDLACQFKLIFDKNMQVGTTYWRPETCAAKVSTAK